MTEQIQILQCPLKYTSRDSDLTGEFGILNKWSLREGGRFRDRELVTLPHEGFTFLLALRRWVPPRETSPAAKSKEKRMFSQAKVLLYIKNRLTVNS